jgi:arabinofuranosyltransferase
MRTTPFWTLAAVLAAGGVFAAILFRTAWISDDAFITLRVVDNTLHGFGPRWNVVERVQVFTHPLWFLLLTAATALTRSAYAATLGLGGAVSLVALVGTALRISSRHVATAVGFVVVLALSRAFVDYSTSGLENPLTHLLLGAFALELLRPGSSDGTRVFRASLWAGLLAVNRMDALLFVAPALAWVVKTRGRRSLRAVAAGFAPFFAWEAFALLYYGSPWPNSALAKLGTGLPPGELIGQGVLYFADAVHHDPVTPLLIVAGIAAAFVRRDPARRALATGLALDATYVVWIGGDFMAGRFLSAPAFLGAILLADAIVAAGVRARAWMGGTLVAAGAYGAIPVLIDSHYACRVTEMVRRSGIADERRYYFSSTGMIASSGLSGSDAFVVAGRDLERNHVPLTVQRSVGYIGYVAGPSVHIVDTFAIADPFLARLPADRNDNWRIGHFRRTPPAGYLATVATGENRIQDPGCRALWERVARLTRGPVLSTARFGDIVAGALGRLGSASRPLSPGPDPWGELVTADPSNPEPHYELGLAALKAGNLDAAAGHLEDALSIAPRLERALVALAVCRMHAGKLAEVAELLRRAEAITRDDADAVRAGAALADARDDVVLAATLYRNSVALNPKWTGSLYARLAAMDARHGAGPAALSWLAQAESISGDDPETATNCGDAYTILGKTVDARAAYERALLADPAYGPAAIGLRRLKAIAR